MQQQLVIEKLQQEIYRLKAIQKLDSQASSKPPSTDLLLKPEKPKQPRDKSAGDKSNSSGDNSAGAKSDKPKRKPGGQPGHPGDTRSRAELIQQLGTSFDGVINSDDYSAYNGYKVKAQQKCLAHLLRHFKKVVKLSHGNNPALGHVSGKTYLGKRAWAHSPM